MLVLFLCILVGFVLNKRKLCPANTFMKYCAIASLAEQYRLVLYCALAVALAIPLMYALLTMTA